MNYFNIIEFIIIIIYLYGLIFLTINIKPTILSLSIIFLYTLISTWLLYNKHCHHKLIKYNKKRILFTIIYSIFCCLCKNCAFPCFHYKCRYPPCEENPSGIFTQEQYEFIGRYFQIWEEYTEVFYPGKTIHDYLKMLYET